MWMLKYNSGSVLLSGCFGPVWSSSIPASFTMLTPFTPHDPFQGNSKLDSRCCFSCHTMLGVILYLKTAIEVNAWSCHMSLNHG